MITSAEKNIKSFGIFFCLFLTLNYNLGANYLGVN